jgi:hypothetical protein
LDSAKTSAHLGYVLSKEALARYVTAVDELRNGTCPHKGSPGGEDQEVGEVIIIFHRIRHILTLNPCQTNCLLNMYSANIYSTV